MIYGDIPMVFNNDLNQLWWFKGETMDHGNIMGIEWDREN